MIKTLKTFAFAMLATGATVTAVNAAPITYVATNVLQPVTITLTAYTEATSPAGTKVVSSSLKTANVLAALGPVVGATVGSKTTLDEIATNLVTTTFQTNTVGTPYNLTNFPVGSSTLTLVSNIATAEISSEYEVVSNGGVVVSNTYGTTNLQIGITNATATNTLTIGATSLLVANISGGVTNVQTYGLAANTLAATNATATSTTVTVIAGGVETVTTITATGTNTDVYDNTNFVSTNATIATIANGEATIGTNAVVAAPGTSVTPVDGTNVVDTVDTSSNATVTIITTLGTNSATNTSLGTIGANALTFTSNTVSLGGTTFTNTGGSNFSVLVDGVVVDTNGVVPGTLATAPTPITLSSQISLSVTNIVGATNADGSGTNITISTNLQIVTVTSLPVTNGAPTITTNAGTNFVTTVSSTSSTNTTTGLYIVNGSVNTYVPTNYASITTLTSTNAIEAFTTKTSAEDDYCIEKLSIATPTLTFSVQGFVKQTTDYFKQTKPTTTTAVKSEAWSANGYGSNSTSELILNGPITVGAPTAQKIQ